MDGNGNNGFNGIMDYDFQLSYINYYGFTIISYLAELLLNCIARNLLERPEYH